MSVQITYNDITYTVVTCYPDNVIVSYRFVPRDYPYGSPHNLYAPDWFYALESNEIKMIKEYVRLPDDLYKSVQLKFAMQEF